MRGANEDWHDLITPIHCASDVANSTYSETSQPADSPFLTEIMQLRNAPIGEVTNSDSYKTVAAWRGRAPSATESVQTSDGIWANIRLLVELDCYRGGVSVA